MPDKDKPKPQPTPKPSLRDLAQDLEDVKQEWSKLNRKKRK